MKKILSIFLLTLCIVFVGCEGDDVTYKAPEALSITKSELYFLAEGGAGLVEVVTGKALSAESSVDWCTTNVSGGVVTVTASGNNALESRAGVITITDGILISKLAVTQEGSVFGISENEVSFIYAGQQIPVSFKSDFDIQVAVKDDWLTYEVKDNSIVFSCKSSKVLNRSTEVTVTSGDRTKTIKINQLQLAGTYTVKYRNADNIATTCTATLVKGKAETSFFLMGDDLPLGALLEFKYEGGQLRLYGGQYLGQMDDYYVFIGLISLTAGKITFSSAVTYVAPLKTNSGGNAVFTFTDGGTWGTYKVDTIEFSGSETIDITTGYAVFFDRMSNLVLTSISLGN